MNIVSVSNDEKHLLATDYSGVLIGHDINSGRTYDVTIATQNEHGAESGASASTSDAKWHCDRINRLLFDDTGHLIR